MSSYAEVANIKQHAEYNVKTICMEAGYNPMCISSKPIGKGAHHFVYLYSSPNDEVRLVLKIPNRTRFGLPINQTLEELYNAIIANNFPDYYVPTKVIATSTGFCVAAEYIEGRPLLTSDIQDKDSQIYASFLSLLRCNLRLQINQGMSLDLIGLDGVSDMLHPQSLFGRPIRFSNVFVPKDNPDSLKLVGHNPIFLNDHHSPTSRLKQASILLTNQFIINTFCQANLSL